MGLQASICNKVDSVFPVLSQQDEQCRRQLSISGIGPLIATALVTAVGSGQVFKNGREMAAWLELGPRQAIYLVDPRTFQWNLKVLLDQ